MSKKLTTIKGIWLEHQNHFVTDDGEFIEVYGYATTNQQFIRPLSCMMLLQLESYGYKIVSVLPLDEEVDNHH